MPCNEWKSSLIGRLYGEIDPAEDAALDDHLAACAGCRDELTQLAGTRRALEGSLPDVPGAPRIVVLESRPAVRPWMAFAAGIACACLLGAGALVAGYRIGGTRATEVAASSVPTPVDPHLVDRIQAIEARLAQPRPAETAAQGAAPLTRDDLDDTVARLEKKLTNDRAADLEYLQDYVLTQVVASEQRTGLRTREAMRYAALASNPNVSER